MLGQLECAAYSARVLTRGAGGSVVWEEIPFTSLTYERVLDDTSAAQVKIDGVDEGCDAKTKLAKVRSWQHEVAIYRNGPRVWVGPIVQRGAVGPSANLNARDRSAWWDRRFLHLSYGGSADLATFFLAYFNDAMSPSPITGFTCSATPTGITGTRSIDALDHRVAGPEMRELAALGIDWSVIDAVCVAGGKTIPTGRLPVITDDHLRSDPTITAEGLAQVNRQVITGQQPQDSITGQFVEGARVYGEYSDATRQARDGLLEANTQDDRAADAASAAAGAQSLVAINGDEPVVTESLDLAANAPLTMTQLIPGALIDIELSRPAISVSGVYRIQKVSVTVDKDGERVSIDVQPVGTT